MASVSAFTTTSAEGHMVPTTGLMQWDVHEDLHYGSERGNINTLFRIQTSFVKMSSESFLEDLTNENFAQLVHAFMLIRHSKPKSDLKCSSSVFERVEKASKQIPSRTCCNCEAVMCRNHCGRATRLGAFNPVALKYAPPTTIRFEAETTPAVQGIDELASLPSRHSGKLPS